MTSRNKMFSYKLFLYVVLLSHVICPLVRAQIMEFNDENEDKISDEMDNFSGDGDQESIEENECTVNRFVSNLNISRFLPEDYEDLRNANISRIVPHIKDTFDKFERIRNWTLKMYNNNELSEVMKTIISRSYDTIYELDLEPECLSALFRIATGMQNTKIWAFKFIDAMGKLPSGLLEGVFSSFGEFDECLDIESPPEDGSPIYGQYCLLKPVIPYPELESYEPNDEILSSSESFKFGRDVLKQNKVDKYWQLNSILKFIEHMTISNGTLIRLGICIPHKCRAESVEKALNNVLYPIIGIPMEINESNCYVKNYTLQLDSYQLISVIVFSILIGLVLLSTGYEIYLKNIEPTKKPISDNKTIKKLMLSFSIISNTNKLLEEDNRFASIDSIRLLLAFGLGALQIYNYTPLALALKRYSNSVPKHMLYYNRYFFARTPGLWIEPFMLTVGLVLSYTIIGKLDKSNGKFNYITYILKRWIRISVSLFGSILIIYLMPLTGSGPIWHDCNVWLQPSCRDLFSLLSSFLYISNWNAARHNYPLTASFEICNLPTWFLSASFQFYLIAPLLFLILYKWPKIGLKINITLIIIGIFLNISPKVFMNDLTYFEPTRFPSVRSQHKYFNNYHVNTFQYVCTFFMGMFTGYAIRRYPKIYIGGPIVERIFNLTAIALIPLVYMWNNTFWILNDSPPEISVLLFFAFGKFFWGLSFAWICFACCTGRAEMINRVLSNRSVQPIAKLYYLIYLLRLPVIFYRIFTVKQTFVMTDYQTFQNLMADFILTVILAYFLFIIMECPALNIIQIIETLNKTNSLQINQRNNFFIENYIQNINNNCDKRVGNYNHSKSITEPIENYVTKF